MNKTLTDKELKKFIEVLGKYQVQMLWVQSKVKLTSKQLDYLNEYIEEKED